MLGTWLGLLLSDGPKLGVEDTLGAPARATFTTASLFTKEVKVIVRVSSLLPLKLLIEKDWPASSAASAMEIFVSTDVSLETTRT